MLKKILLLTTLAISVKVLALPTMSEIITSSDLKPILMDFEDAEDFCHDMAARLPTAREYAALATRLGAPALREPRFPHQSVESPAVRAETAKYAAQGFSRIDTNTPSGRVVPDFYYNRRGYRRSQFTPQTKSWTSSTLKLSRRHQAMPYAFEERTAALAIYPVDSRFAVRCMQ
jgi:hypothetical protein